MYLWDSNILRHFVQKHPTLQRHLERVAWDQIALPSIVVAEVLRGRCDYALKATPQQAPLAHQRLRQTQVLLAQFQVVVFDEKSAEILQTLQKRIKTRKRYADVMIAATALAGNHIVVTRNEKHFRDLLPAQQLVNWIDR